MAGRRLRKGQVRGKWVGSVRPEDMFPGLGQKRWEEGVPHATKSHRLYWDPVGLGYSHQG